ncbi:MAG: hypothetical protein QNJ54_14610 [Prochloraceae cyanobacterium]|nr:hypothetical protein [Prochloraceae cyanobacterium]
MTNQKERVEHRGVPGWLELYDLSLHRDMEARIPMSPYIRGMVIFETRFEPDDEITGKAREKPPEAALTPGWVNLTNVQFHSDVEAIAPIPPYVHGEIDEQQHFYPDEPFKISGEPATAQKSEEKR